MLRENALDDQLAGDTVHHRGTSTGKRRERVGGLDKRGGGSGIGRRLVVAAATAELVELPTQENEGEAQRMG